MARQGGLLDRMGLLLPYAHVGWRSLDEMAEPGYEQSDTISQPHLNVRVCIICITPGAARTRERRHRVALAGLNGMRPTHCKRCGVADIAIRRLWNRPRR